MTVAGRTQSPVVRQALIRFAASAVAAVAVLALMTLVVADQIARHRALEDARLQVSNLATRLAAPLITDDVRAGRAGAAGPLDTVMANRMGDGSVQRVKVWDEDGRVIWADADQLVGRVFEMEGQVSALFGTRDTYAEVSDLDRAENVAEQAEEQLLEVYAGAVAGDGRPVVVEAYLPTRQMHDYAQDIVGTLVPLAVGTLLLFLAVVLPLAYSLARRVDFARAERGALMQHALRATDLERRRISHDLHDGVIQDLSGLGYLLPTVRKKLRSGGDLERADALLEQATDVLYDDVVALRALMVDIYPPSLDGDGLRQALTDLLTVEAATSGLTAEIDMDPDLDVPLDTGRLVYRVAREAVRNVVKHARATTVRLEVHTTTEAARDTVRVVVRDDGVGPGDALGQAPDGHMGIRLAADTVADFGGVLDIRADPDGGTVVDARFPRVLVPG